MSEYTELERELFDALLRLKTNFYNFIAGRPVRDLAETFAEAEAALAKFTARAGGEG